MNEIEKKAEELETAKKAAEAAAVEAKTAAEAATKAAADAASKLETKGAELDAAIKSVNAADETIKARMLELDGMKKSADFLPLNEAIAEVITSDQFKADHTAGKHKGASVEYELKASTADIITPTVNAQINQNAIFRPTRPLAFFDNMRKAYFQQDKNTLVWLAGAYASNVGYIGEGVAIADGDTVNVEEESRGVAKISAKLKITEEMRGDTSYVSSLLANQMSSKAMLWIDKQLYSGDGVDSDNAKKKHIYGLKTHATVFSATKAGVAASFQTPTLTELTAAVKLQGQMIDTTVATNSDDPGYNIDLVYLNPIDAEIWRHTKDTTGRYIIQQLADGTQVMNGMRVIETKAIAANTLFAMDSNVATLWVKRNPVLKFGQEQDDFSTDHYTYVMFTRIQLVVEPRDTKGLIYVSDIKAALATLEIPAGA